MEEGAGGLIPLSTRKVDKSEKKVLEDSSGGRDELVAHKMDGVDTVNSKAGDSMNEQEIEDMENDQGDENIEVEKQQPSVREPQGP